MPCAVFLDGREVELVPFEPRMNGFVSYEAIEAAGGIIKAGDAQHVACGLSTPELLTLAVGPAPGVCPGSFYMPMPGPGIDQTGVARWQAPPAKS